MSKTVTECSKLLLKDMIENCGKKLKFVIFFLNDKRSKIVENKLNVAKVQLKGKSNKSVA